jgi:serine/threonine protein kinase
MSTQNRQRIRRLHHRYAVPKVGKTIGEGTFGKVKSALHKPTNQNVAIKILEKNRISEVADV